MRPSLRASHAPLGSRRAWVVYVSCFVLFLLVSPIATLATAASTAHCSNQTEFYCIPGGRDYRGSVSTTVSGLTCQAWSSQSPWPHTETYPDPVLGIGDHNHCRYMDALQRVGCYTTDPNVQVEPCDIGEPCECVYPDKTVTFTPPSGTHMVADGSTNFVTLQCFPSPCDLYYTINGDAPVLGNAIPYNGLGIMLTNNTMVRALAVYADGTLNRFATYVVDPPYTPDPSLAFVPATDVVYSGPVLAHLTGIKEGEEVLLFVGDAAPIKYTPGDSFWVSNTSEVTAVIDGVRTVTATYVIRSAAPTFAVYPVSGTFVGGIRVVIYAEGARELYASVNGGEEVKLASSALLVDNVGLTVVIIRAVYLGGVVSQSVHRYEVLEALPPTMSPAQALFSRPVNVTCADPRGKALAVRSLSGDAAAGPDSSTNDDDDLSYQVALTKPGTYTLNCSYTDNLYHTHTTTHTVTLEALPLPAPVPTPACGMAFPNTPLFLHAQVVAAADGLTGAGTEYALNLRTDSAEGRVQFVEQLNLTNFAYALMLTAAANSVSVTLQSTSTAVMEADSEPVACTYPIHALGSHRTALHVARPVCATFEDTAGGVVPAECVQDIAFQLASCLHFYTTDLLDLHVYGPLVTIRVNQLAEALETVMYQRVHTCLVGSADTPVSVNVTSVRGEVNDTIQLATGWRLVDGISVVVRDEKDKSPRQESISDASFLVRVTGWHVASGAYYFVRESHTCFDLGVSPASDIFADDSSTNEGTYTSSVDTSGTALVAFSVSVPGTYKLCARFNSTVYEVETFAPLTVTPRPWPTLAPVRADTCGGLVDTAFASAPLTVAFDAGPAQLSPLLSTYWYSVDGSASWQTKPLGNALTVPSVQSFASPSRVVAATLGAVSGVQAACVFYAPAVQPAVNLSGMTYHFYATPATPTPAGTGVSNTTRDLVLLVAGSFLVAEVMHVSLTSPVWATPYDALNSSEAVWISRGSTSLTTSVAVNRSLAVPVRAIRVESSSFEAVWHVVGSFDGVEVTLSPSRVALSDLSVGMVSSSTCASGYQYTTHCVCIGTVNKTAYLCGNVAPTPPVVPTVPSWERIVAMIAYLVLIAVIVVYIAYSVISGEQHQSEAEDITIEVGTGSPVAPRAAPSAAGEGGAFATAHSPAHAEDADADVAPEEDAEGDRSSPSPEGSENVEVNAANWF